MSRYDQSIFIFRRDYRLADNLGLIEALQNSRKVIPIFILTPEQLDRQKNKYKSDHAVQFMIQSLLDLNQQLRKKKSRLFFFYGSPNKMVDKILKKYKSIEAIYVNLDYSPYSTKRDHAIQKVCKKYQVDFHSIHDGLLHPVGSIRTSSTNRVYSKFTPFFKLAKTKKVATPFSNLFRNYLGSRNKIKGEYVGDLHRFYQINENLWKNGGRTEALQILKNLKEYRDYNDTRNVLNDETTHLSAYIKFGCVSIREVYHAFRKQLGMRNDLIKQLFWRDFYHNIIYAYPHVVGQAMKPKYNKITWINHRKHFSRWCQGMTGYPIVDASMRSMNQTGYMHNRGRLIVSNFLVKILMIDWRWGEKYFSQKLMDIDIANNNGNWQWGASTGADSQPYFRIFNPWLQSKKFDPEGEFIKKWIPELEDVNPQHLHHWNKYWKEYDEIDYPEPMVDYKKARDETLKRYKQVV